MSKTVKLAIGAGVIVLAIAYLMVSGFAKGTLYYVTPSELLAQKSRLGSRSVRLAGELVGSSVKWQPGEMRLTFDLRESATIIHVRYRGIKPDNFDDGRKIVVDGRLDPDGTFVGQKILVQCPSKYEEAPKSGGGN